MSTYCLALQEEAAGTRGELTEAQRRLAAAQADADVAQDAQRDLQTCLDVQQLHLVNVQAAYKDLEDAQHSAQVAQGRICC